MLNYNAINTAMLTTMANNVDNNIDGFLANGVSLSPEGLLIYCQTQLKSLDNDIQAFMDQQKKMQTKKKILQDLKSTIETNNTVNKPSGNEQKIKTIADGFKKAYDELQAAGMTDEAAALALECKEWFPKGDLTATQVNTEGNKVPTGAQSEFDAKIKPLADTIDDIGKNAELNMIQLQSLVSARQTAIQLTTNILDKFQKGLDMIAANLK